MWYNEAVMASQGLLTVPMLGTASSGNERSAPIVVF